MSAARSWILAMATGSLLVPGVSGAASVSFQIDVRIIGSLEPTMPVGFYERAGRFSFDDSLLASVGPSLVSWGQLDMFGLRLGPARFDVTDIRDALLGEDLGTGAGPGGCYVLPVCGIVFDGGQPLGIVGQLFVPQSNSTPFWGLSLANTSPGASDLTPGFESLGIGTNPPGERGITVASGPFSIRPSRPIPEARSILLFWIGLALVAGTMWRRAPSRARSSRLEVPRRS